MGFVSSLIKQAISCALSAFRSPNQKPGRGDVNFNVQIAFRQHESSDLRTKKPSS